MPPAPPPAAPPAAADDGTRLELGVLPGATYTTDAGLGLGVVASLAGVGASPVGGAPYRWRLEGQLFASARTRPGGGVELVTHDDFVSLDVPGRLRWRAGVAWKRSLAAGYHGLGNESTAAPGRAGAYDRRTASVTGDVRIALRGPLQLFAGGRASRHGVGVYAGSRLEADRARLSGAEDHGELQVSAAILHDRRDHEPAPSRGLLTEVGVRAGAGLGARYAYGGGTVAARLFLPLAGPRLVLALRAVGDLLWGDPPFFEQARAGGLSAGVVTGGGTSIRGVPSERYHGRAKLLGNAELRARLVPFRLGRQACVLGALTFIDAGRILGGAVGGADLGLHLGAGGGLRLEWGRAFVVRIDVAASPEGTSGLYIDVGHAF
jgi:hypothetical protein